jgi:hypothetical protein
VVSRRFDWIAASIGRIAFLSSVCRRLNLPQRGR